MISNTDNIINDIKITLNNHQNDIHKKVFQKNIKFYDIINEIELINIITKKNKIKVPYIIFDSSFCISFWALTEYSINNDKYIRKQKKFIPLTNLINNDIIYEANDIKIDSNDSNFVKKYKNIINHYMKPTKKNNYKMDIDNYFFDKI